MSDNAPTHAAYPSATPARRTPAIRTYRNACPNPPRAYIVGFVACDVAAPLAARFGIVVWDESGVSDYLQPAYLTRNNHLIIRQSGVYDHLPRSVRNAIRREAINKLEEMQNEN